MDDALSADTGPRDPWPLPRDGMPLVAPPDLTPDIAACADLAAQPPTPSASPRTALSSVVGWDQGVALLRATPTAVVAMDTAGRITVLNATAEQLLNTTTARAAGRPYPEVFSASLAERMLALFLRANRSGDPGTGQALRAALPDGRPPRYPPGQRRPVA